MERNGKIIVLALLLLPVAFAASGQETFTNSIGMNFVEVPGGSFRMGSPSGGYSDERPVHTVTLTDFWMGATEVTQGQWRSVMGNTWSATDRGIGDNYPVNQVNWTDTLLFANLLSMREGLTPVYSINGSTDPARWGTVPTSQNSTWDAVQANWNADGYRLPTEAEWEYAARGGTVSRGYTYAGSNDVNAVAWHDGNANFSTHPVGTRQANELGLYDMSGNVWEWCWDWFGSYTAGDQTNPRGAASGSDRVLRGGSWSSPAAYTRSAIRINIDPISRNSNNGFRLVRSLPRPAVVQSWNNSMGIRFMAVPGGSFQMGNPSGGDSDERPVHTVTLTGFWIGATEVTQGQWRSVMGNNPSDTNRGIGDNYPVSRVRWYDTLVFANRLSIQEGLTPVYSISGSTDPARWGAVPTSQNSTWDAAQVNWNATGYRLPTEAEWEYAARGGTVSRWYTYAGSNDVNAVAWNTNNASNSTHPVGTKQANELGLYDMSGNVWEWCWDWYGSYTASNQTDPRGAASGSYRVIRGGCWYFNVARTRSAARYSYDPHHRLLNFGFRLVRSQSH